MHWHEWMYVHVDPFANRLAAYVDIRDEGVPDALYVAAAVTLDDLDDDDADALLDTDDPQALLDVASRRLGPDFAISLATQEFLDQMRTEDGWDGSAPWSR